MAYFTIVFHDGSSKEFEATDKNELIKNYCMFDATKFQEEVKEIRWKEAENTIECVETISNGLISKEKLEL